MLYYHIIQLFNFGLNELAHNSGLDLSPTPMKHKIEKWNSIIFPSSQQANDTVVNKLFDTLDMIEDHLSNGLTLADVCLFTTLIQFDLVYNPFISLAQRCDINMHLTITNGYYKFFISPTGKGKTKAFLRWHLP
ncbi:glutathione S-transferase omega-like 2 [Pyrus ussuriensis x Pyrus communis]|uniref:Glutathione S-transferase omega-like 2 n=1 Tax=Pyrus ussuriensis x Pyrus communis TaxID=2448454 RepID=A0A5N5H6I6_9ROSA|nr:glutathione S-transferase omega-like 2 [Pyrus ussuriensis x Pyrus communis]